LVTEIEDFAGGGLYAADPASGAKAPESDQRITEYICCLGLLISAKEGNAMRGRNGLMKVSQTGLRQGHGAGFFAERHHRMPQSEINPIFEYNRLVRALSPIRAE